MKRWMVIIFVLVVAVFAVLFFQRESAAIIASLSRISPVAFVIFVAVSIFNLWLYAWRWDLIIHAGKKSKMLSLGKLLGVKFSAYALAYLIPSAQLAGEPLRLSVLEGAGVDRKEAVGGMIVDKVFEAVTLAVFALSSLLLLLANTQQHGGGQDMVTFGVLGVTILGFILFFYFTIVKDGFFIMLFRLFQLHRIPRLRKYTQKIIDTEKVIENIFTGHPRELFWIIVISIVTYLELLLEYYIMLGSLGIWPSFTQIMAVSTLPLVSYLMPTPGGAGALEVAQAAALQLAGMDPLLAIPLIVYIRLRDVVFILIGLGYASTHGLSSFLKSSD